MFQNVKRNHFAIKLLMFSSTYWILSRYRPTTNSVVLVLLRYYMVHLHINMLFNIKIYCMIYKPSISNKNQFSVFVKCSAQTKIVYQCSEHFFIFDISHSLPSDFRQMYDVPTSIHQHDYMPISAEVSKIYDIAWIRESSIRMEWHASLSHLRL